MDCKKCGKSFPRRVQINGKFHNFQRRQYCLDCSPFGEHNTKRIHFTDSVSPAIEPQESLCYLCGSVRKRAKSGSGLCWTCANRKARKRKTAKIQSVTGKSCWICGYSSCWQAMDFHHIDPSTKLFNITTLELQFTWDRVIKEVKKCALLCCRCHREAHAGLISPEHLKHVWESKWNEIENTGEGLFAGQYLNG